jgi:hypothetical protein
MQDRLTMVNFYLLASGVITSGVVVMLGTDTSLPSSASASVGTVLMWLLHGVGCIHFLLGLRAGATSTPYHTRRNELWRQSSHQC